jgi:hypothetical protein
MAEEKEAGKLKFRSTWFPSRAARAGLPPSYGMCKSEMPGKSPGILPFKALEFTLYQFLNQALF